MCVRVLLRKMPKTQREGRFSNIFHSIFSTTFTDINSYNPRFNLFLKYLLVHNWDLNINLISNVIFGGVNFPKLQHVLHDEYLQIYSNTV